MHLGLPLHTKEVWLKSYTGDAEVQQFIEQKDCRILYVTADASTGKQVLHFDTNVCVYIEALILKSKVSQIASIKT